MPNWAKGYLRLRGSREAILAFIENEMEYVAENVVDGWQTVCRNVEINKDTDDEEFYIPVNAMVFGMPLAERVRWPALHIKGTARNFIDRDIDIILEKGNANNTVVIPGFMAAWDANAVPYLDASKKYGLEMKIDVYERGMQFSHHIHIVNGCIMNDKEETYGNWAWDCPCPDFGG